ncbi:hypothetical protein [Persicobacter sp. CCB-QB2]|uniref:hypothetical protein n=1 Tax=Persicobacter sp. CCB-QB2 TaxID=1561025 RepID=UPI0006A9488F|nr:hypothetical protein [Persicobacter sp. CCB-QB2]
MDSLDLISRYKKRIQKSGNQNELYKWELLKKYRGKPDVEADDFQAEIASLNFGNLLYHLSVAVLKDISKYSSQDLREAFRYLFDEKHPLQQRIDEFKRRTNSLFEAITPGKSSFQDERSISVYLAFFDGINIHCIKVRIMGSFANSSGLKKRRPEKSTFII